MQQESRPKRARLAADRRSLELFRSRARLTALVELEEAVLGKDGTVGEGARAACLHPGGGVSGCFRSSAAACGREGDSQRGVKEELSLPRKFASIEEADGVCGNALASGGRRGVSEKESSVSLPSVTSTASLGENPKYLLPSETLHSLDPRRHKATPSSKPSSLVTGGDESCPSPEKSSHKPSKSAASGDIAPACAVAASYSDHGYRVSRLSITLPRVLENQEDIAVNLLKTVHRTQDDDDKGCSGGDDVEGCNIDVKGCDDGKQCNIDDFKGCNVGNVRVNECNDGVGCNMGDDVEGCHGEGVRIVAARTPMLSRGERHAFTVLGLSGEFAERVLLLPTSARRRETVGDRSAETVLLRWGTDGISDSSSPIRHLRLSRVRCKPSIPNPLPALALALSWALELGEDIVPGVTLPLLPEGLWAIAPINGRDSTLLTNKNKRSADFDGRGNKINSCSGIGGDEVVINPQFDSAASAAVGASSQRKLPGKCHGNSRKSSENVAKLSIGAAWILAHLVFGQKATRSRFPRKCFYIGTLEETLRVGRQTSSPGVGGRISVWGGEARVLSPMLLSCPDVGWCPPEREDMLAAAGDAGGGSMSVFVASVGSVIGERDEEWTRREGGRLRRAACRELVEAGLCSWVAEEEKGGGGKGVVGLEVGLLALREEVALAFEICLQIFADHWAPEREKLATAALGVVKTAPMTTAAAIAQDRRFSAISRMRGRLGSLCVRLTAWSIEVSSGVGNSDQVENRLWKILKPGISGDSGSARAWSGPMAEALGLLGGDRRYADGWISSMSKGDRLREMACLRLKRAVEKVIDLVCSVIEGWQTEGRYADAILLLQLLVRRNQGVAGDAFHSAPDLLWAADWCTFRFRGWMIQVQNDALGEPTFYNDAWIRLSLNLEKCGEFAESLEALRSASEDCQVRGGERLEVRDRLISRHRKYGNPDDTPPVRFPTPQDSEEYLEVDMLVGKERRRKHHHNVGRLLFFDGRKDYDNHKGMFVEDVVLRKRREAGGWLGVHCESRGVTFLMMLLLWEDVFQSTEEAAAASCDHCFTDRPFDFYDPYFYTRRRGGLETRLDTMRKATDEELWHDVDVRFERYKGVKCVWCSWTDFTKQQMMEMAVAFGGRRLSSIFKALTRDLPHMQWGFPDLILWRPKRGRTTGNQGGTVRDRKTGEFELNWKAYGQGWDIEVVEVKSVNDTLSYVQKAWLSLLRNAGVPAKVVRVFAKGGNGGTRGR